MAPVHHHHHHYYVLRFQIALLLPLQELPPQDLPPSSLHHNFFLSPSQCLQQQPLQPLPLGLLPAAVPELPWTLLRHIQHQETRHCLMRRNEEKQAEELLEFECVIELSFKGTCARMHQW
jgi:hypothetical protein